MKQTIWRSLITVVAAMLTTGSCFLFIEQGEPNGVIVQFFEWPFKDIARECLVTLGPDGFSGVQVSPITEHVILYKRPWEERYEPVSYKIISRSGNETEFREMVTMCSRSEVKVYVDVVLNHMTKEYETEMQTTGGSKFDSMYMSYPALHYTKVDFHEPCTFTDEADELNKNYVAMQNCKVNGRHDLDHTRYHVICEITKFLNKLMEIGVAGFSIDSAKNMLPSDLREIFIRLDYLNSYTGFMYGAKPFIYQDITEYQMFPYEDYLTLGAVTDYSYANEISKFFRGEQPLKLIQELKYHIPSSKAVVFVDNHLTERGLVTGMKKTLTYEDNKLHKLAMIFMLAWDHGTPKIMSGFTFETANEGPTTAAAYSTVNSEGYCQYRWTCVHRYKEVVRMMQFRKLAQSEPVLNWWNSEKQNQIAFSRGDKAFVAINLSSVKMNEVLKTGLQSGSYCDIFSGELKARFCTGKVINVDVNGMANIQVDPNSAVVIHIWSMK